MAPTPRAAGRPSGSLSRGMARGRLVLQRYVRNAVQVDLRGETVKTGKGRDSLIKTAGISRYKSRESTYIVDVFCGTMVSVLLDLLGPLSLAQGIANT